MVALEKDKLRHGNIAVDAGKPASVRLRDVSKIRPSFADFMKRVCDSLPLLLLRHFLTEGRQ